MRLAAAALAASAGSAAGSGSAAGPGWLFSSGSSCPAGVKVVEGLDMEKYPGTWYEVASQNVGLLSSCSCSRYEYKMTGALTFDDRFTCTKGGKAGGLDLVLKGRIPDAGVLAKQDESPLYSWLPTAPYWVLEVGKDYEYAVVYACVPVVGEYIYVFHRNPQALTSGLIDLDAIKARLTAQGIDASQVRVVPQPANCSYPPSDTPMAKTSGGEPTVPLATFDGAPATTHTWKEMNDPVMGGKSVGTTSVEGGMLVFDGTVAIVPSLNAPGFITSQVSDGFFHKGFPDVSKCKGVSLNLKSSTDFKGYRFCFGNKHARGGKFFAYGFKAHFDAPVGEFGTVDLPFNEFTDFWDDATGNPIKTCQESPENCPDAATLQNMKTMAFWGEGVEGKVHLEVKSVSAYGCAGSAEVVV